MLSLLAFVLKLFFSALLGGFLAFSTDVKNQRDNIIAAAFVGLSSAALLHVAYDLVEMNQGIALGLGLFTCVWLALNLTHKLKIERRAIMVSVAITGALTGSTHFIIAVAYAVIAKIIFYAGARYFSDSADQDEKSLM